MGSENDESYRVQATEENRKLLRQELSNQEIRKVLVKVDIPIADEDTLDKVLDGLDRGLKNYYLTIKRPEINLIG